MPRGKIKWEKIILTLTATRPMWGMAFLRLIFGITLVLEGLTRYRFLRHEPLSVISQLPGEWAFALIITFSVIEIIAGLCSLSGFAMRLVGFLITAEMLASIFFERAPLDFSRSLETQVLFLAIAVMVLFSGAGRFSVDRLIARRLLRKHPSTKKELYCIAETPYTKWWE